MPISYDNLPDMILATAIAITWLSGIALQFCGLYHGIRAAFCRRSDAPYRWLVALNPFNAAWFADQLNEVGLMHRRQGFKFLRWAVASWGTMAVLAVVLFLTR
jgi:hypothetical protein